MDQPLVVASKYTDEVPESDIPGDLRSHGFPPDALFAAGSSLA